MLWWIFFGKQFKSHFGVWHHYFLPWEVNIFSLRLGDTRTTLWFVDIWLKMHFWFLYFVVIFLNPRFWSLNFQNNQLFPHLHDNSAIFVNCLHLISNSQKYINPYHKNNKISYKTLFIWILTFYFFDKNMDSHLITHFHVIILVVTQLSHLPNHQKSAQMHMGGKCQTFWKPNDQIRGSKYMRPKSYETK